MSDGNRSDLYENLSRNTSLRMTPTMYKRLLEVAAMWRTTPQQVMRVALQHALNDLKLIHDYAQRFPHGP